VDIALTATTAIATVIVPRRHIATSPLVVAALDKPLWDSPHLPLEQAHWQ
jgi:hypothetical protein